MSNLYLGLVHGPVLNKRGAEVTTSVTNLDIHDIARTSRTFGFKNYFIITPIKAQHELLNRILTHWDTDEANDYNPDRKDALSFIQLVDSVELGIAAIEKLEGQKPKVAVTGANFKTFDGGAIDLKNQLKIDKKPLFLLFGTGWGLTASIINLADFRLEPIYGNNSDGYNHLSVRSAVAIYCDRLQGSL